MVCMTPQSAVSRCVESVGLCRSLSRLRQYLPRSRNYVCRRRYGLDAAEGARGSEPSGCCCAEEPSDAKTVLVEYLYLDLQSCERCIGTDRVLDEVMEALTPVLQLAGYGVRYRKIEMKTAKLAEQFHFLSSPTIRVNGCDFCQAVQENSCGCCSDIARNGCGLQMFSV